MSTPESVRESRFDELIQDFYGQAVISEWSEFRNCGLSALCEWAGAAGAVWITLSHSSVIGEFTEFPAELGISRSTVTKLTKSGDFVEKLLSPVPSELQSPKLADTMRVQVQRYSHRKTALDSVVLVYFRGNTQPPALLSRAVGHLVEAGSLSLHQYIQRDEWLLALGRSNRGTAAVIDSGGVIYAASKRFRELVAAEDGSPDFTELPFALPNLELDGTADFVLGPLHFRVSPLGGVFQMYARKPLPLDGLSPREQQIARALGNGKTFKSVARQYDIAVSTVANHASRIYRKLGIYRREDLVDLVRRPAANSSDAAPPTAAAR
ncbi:MULTISPECIES: helix-turn-helix transcriptional regulator [Hydrocarboniphaga]|uniref:helix-turn-helix transcriptional regulator n=1 Tax=Hydrocarboniphaga TaxID=243627 RepID=UPI002AB8690D|nr:helix-turn-helix transcriptional regulator [Hydrocarboniphaga sp.]MDZ4076783.1 helix-turn-helix transcriptional regulator [Hydrocarboniphaga sp.]